MSAELEALQEIARAATYEALKSYEPVPEKWKEHLTLGTFFDGNERIFQLYVAAERPAEAIILSTARVNRLTKEISVTVSNLKPIQV